jgi:hypothetical protein
MNNPKYIIVHHAGGTDANPMQDSSGYTFEQCNQDHKARFDFKSTLGYYVGYHYFVDKYGMMTQARADNEEGAHCIGQNTSSLGICLAGNFDATLPTDSQVITLKKFLIEKSKQYNILPENVVPHRAFAQKTCYGKRLADNWARDLLVVEEAPVVPPVVNQNNDMLKVATSWDAVKNILANARVKSFFWRTGMMISAVVVNEIITVLGSSGLNTQTIVILGLILGEISKSINNALSGK